MNENEMTPASKTNMQGIISYNGHSLKDLNLSDDYLFAKVMIDPDICRRVLEQILKIPIRKVSPPAEQKSIRILPESKGIRLDIYVNDDQGTVYNVEMQTGHKKELPKRTRYYQGNIDLDLIAAGALYSALKPSFVIFICTFDPFGSGRHLYTFENICREDTDIRLGDETVKILLNTRGTINDIDDDLREFLGYVENTTDAFARNADSQLVRDIHDRVTRIKDDRRFQVEYMTLYMKEQEIRSDALEEGRAAGLAEGKAKGLAEGREAGRAEGQSNALRSVARNMHALGDSVTDIAARLGVTPQAVTEMLEDAPAK